MTSYVDIKDRLVEALGGQPDDVFGSTAITAYGLELAR